MKQGNAYTELPLNDLFEDFERARILVYRPCGWERAALERRVDAGEIARPLPGLYARAAYWDGLSREEKMRHILKTEGIAHPSWTFTHASAAIVHGLAVPHALFWPVHYATRQPGGGKAAGHFAHHRFEGRTPVTVDGTKVSGVAQAVVDCARIHPFREALAIADSALHKGLAGSGDLEAVLAVQPGRRGNRAARRVVAVASPLPESGGESIVRALMMELGLPEPELQAPVEDSERPGRVWRVDFLLRPEGGAPVAFELDGLEKYRNIAMTRGEGAVSLMARERQREASITAHGIRVLRMGFRDASNPDLLLKKLARYGIVPVR